MTFSATTRMPLILFWAEVEEEDANENSIFSGLMKMEEDEEEEKETVVFLG